jgi:hypothetical protein
VGHEDRLLNCPPGSRVLSDLIDVRPSRFRVTALQGAPDLRRTITVPDVLVVGHHSVSPSPNSSTDWASRRSSTDANHRVSLVPTYPRWLSTTALQVVDSLGHDRPYDAGVRLTESYKDVVPQAILDRFEWAEVRNAAAVLRSTNPAEFQDLLDVLEAFYLEPLDILFPGGQKSRLAARVDLQFREKGWREGQHDTTVTTVLRRMPWRPSGEKTPNVDTFTTENPGYKVDNVKGTVALDVEWNAKDGNLDRDVGQYRTLHDSAVIDVAVMVTRDFDTILALATRLGRPDPFGGTTTTTLTKLQPRMGRGAAGGCPVLAIAITDRPYVGTAESEAEAKRIADAYEAERKRKKQKGIPAIEGEDEEEDEDDTLGLDFPDPAVGDQS